jgi:D-alanine-D-alanine ligase
VRRLAAAAFEAVSGEGCPGGPFYTPDGEIVLNEINTMPGMTAASISQNVGSQRVRCGNF